MKTQVKGVGGGGEFVSLHTMKVSRGSGGINSLILKLGSVWR
jgi:hypothetical protein